MRKDFVAAGKPDRLESEFIRERTSEKDPLRSTLFVTWQMEEYAETIAKKHRPVRGHNLNALGESLLANENKLLKVHKLFSRKEEMGKPLINMQEWNNNFYLIKSQINKVKSQLKEIDPSLPVIGEEHRIYTIMSVLVAHTNAQIDFKNLLGFISAYQRGSVLLIGEVKCISVAIKMALIENIRRLATRLALLKINRDLAEYWSDEIINGAKASDATVNDVLEKLIKSVPGWEGPFVIELIRCMQKKNAAAYSFMDWIESRLAAKGCTIDQSATLLNAEQAKDRISLRNSISSLRILDTIDWQTVTDSISHIEIILGKEKCGVYSEMDYSTRNRYRTEIGVIAKLTGVPENKIAEKAVFLSDKAIENNSMDECASHVGFYLIGNGRKILEKALGIHSFYRGAVRHLARRAQVVGYPLALLTLTFLLAALLWLRAYQHHLNIAWLISIGILLLIGTSQVAKVVVDRIVDYLAKPEFLPKFDFSKGAPARFSTLVVIPTLVNNQAEIEELIQGLEINFLANSKENLHFGLLTDFKDASTEVLSEDSLLLHKLGTMIRELNGKYQHSNNTGFFLFHRPRTWNKYEQLWMGYERKRGKLMDLNAFLRGDVMNRFSYVVGDRSVLHRIKYVITLDSDTQLPRDSAWKMAGAMAHPLNRPVYSAHKKRIIQGYAMLQPRVKNCSLENQDSYYQRWMGREHDIDPYTHASPNVYQDIFGEGTFVGKGIYDVDMAIKVLGDSFPDNRILSHDLLEGCYLRSGFLNEVTLYERTSNYVVEIKRRHRWIRGDWQISAWAGPLIPKKNNRAGINTLSTLSRWKILDNLRISFLQVAYLLLLLTGIVVGDIVYFTLITVCFILFQSSVDFLLKLFIHPRRFFIWTYWKKSAREIKSHLYLNLFEIVCLPFEAFWELDAIIRVHWRMLISHKRLLEWVPSRNQKSSLKNSLRETCNLMWPGFVFGILLAVCLAVFNAVALVMLSPILLVWIFSPVIAWYISRPLPEKVINLSVGQIAFLRKLSRRTWAYFERFIGDDSNWLPPDHYQEYPLMKVAEYTSPTNIGLALLSALGASDFGYTTKWRAVQSIANTMNTLKTLERFKGHYYNWYNIRTLEPSYPRYVSTVDSGNLAGHLMVLRQGMNAMPYEKMLNIQLIMGLMDAVAIAEEEFNIVSSLKENKTSCPDESYFTPAYCKGYVEKVNAYISGLSIVSAIQQSCDAIYCISSIRQQCSDIISELQLLAPWLWMTPVPAACHSFVQHDIPTLDQLANNDKLFREHDEPVWADEEKVWMDEYKQRLGKSRSIARERIEILRRIVEQCTDCGEMEYDFLYNKSDQSISIGYHVETTALDPGYYDTLCSEARLAIYVAICQGKLPVKSWFTLGRTLINADDSFLTLSANGTMFEYLMPLLVMPKFDNTLLDQACKAAVQSQINYGNANNIPWGISESAYSAMDKELNYQYKVFGVPELSLKHTYPADELVVAPYASALALMITEEEACDNLEQLSRHGLKGRYGLFEAIDYSASFASGNRPYTLVKSFMVHHQGMSFLSLASLLLNKPMQKRFFNDPELASSVFLLQEQIPKEAAFYMHRATKTIIPKEKDEGEAINYSRANHFRLTKNQGVQHLSNGKYHLMITNSGASHSNWQKTALNNWTKTEEDKAGGGVFCFIRDCDERTRWSTTYEPLYNNAGNYTSAFFAGIASFRYRSREFESCTRVVVHPSDNIEMREISIHNLSTRRKTIEVTGYTEALLTQLNSVDDPGTHSYQNEVDCDQHAILYGGNSSSPDEDSPWMFFQMTFRNKNIISVFYETGHPGLTGTSKVRRGAGISIKYKLTIDPGETIFASIVIGIAEDKKSCIDLLSRRYDKLCFDVSIIREARRYCLAALKKVGASEHDLELFQQLAGAILFREQEQSLQNAMQNYSTPFTQNTIVLRINSTSQIEVVEKIIQMHAYWRLNGLNVKVIIWNEDRSCYKDFLQRLIMEMINNGVGAESLNRHEGGIFIESIEKISWEDRALLQRSAYIIRAEEWDILPNRIYRNFSGYKSSVTEKELLAKGLLSHSK